MQASMFNLRVPLPARDEVFLMNTLTDAQMVVSSDVAALLDRFDPKGSDSGVPTGIDVSDDETAAHRAASGERLSGHRS